MFDARGHNLPVGTICIEEIAIGMSRSLSKTIGDAEIAPSPRSRPTTIRCTSTTPMPRTRSSKDGSPTGC